MIVEIRQHNKKLNNRVIGSENKFFQTCKNMRGTGYPYQINNSTKINKGYKRVSNTI